MGLQNKWLQHFAQLFLTFQEPWPNRGWHPKLLCDIEGNMNWKDVRHAPWPEGRRNSFLKLASDINLIVSKGQH